MVSEPRAVATGSRAAEGSRDPVATARGSETPLLTSIEFRLWLFLICSDATCFDLSARIILALHRRAGEPAQHRQLPDVRQRIGHWSLKEAFTASRQIRIRGEVIVEAL